MKKYLIWIPIIGIYFDYKYEISRTNENIEIMLGYHVFCAVIGLMIAGILILILK